MHLYQGCLYTISHSNLNYYYFNLKLQDGHKEDNYIDTGIWFYYHNDFDWCFK